MEGLFICAPSMFNI